MLLQCNPSSNKRFGLVLMGKVHTTTISLLILSSSILCTLMGKKVIFMQHKQNQRFFVNYAHKIDNCEKNEKLPSRIEAINNPMGKHSDFPPLCSNTKRVKRALYSAAVAVLLCIPITNYDQGFTQRENCLVLSLFYIRSQFNVAPFCVWLHSGNVTCNFSPYANQAVMGSSPAFPSSYPSLKVALCN